MRATKGTTCSSQLLSQLSEKTVPEVLKFQRWLKRRFSETFRGLELCACYCLGIELRYLPKVVTLTGPISLGFVGFIARHGLVRSNKI